MIIPVLSTQNYVMAISRRTKRRWRKGGDKKKVPLNEQRRTERGDLGFSDGEGGGLLAFQPLGGVERSSSYLTA